MDTQQRWFIFLLILFIFLSLSVFKIHIGIDVRVGQIILLTLFFLLLQNEYTTKAIDLSLLLFFLISALIISLISLNSIYEKIGESKFIIKYIMIFPAAFYLGSRIAGKLEIKNLITLLETAAFFYCIAAFIIYYLPLPEPVYAYVNYREGAYGSLYLGYQGTFFEAGWFAFAVSITFMSALLLRIDYGIWPQRKTVYSLLSLFIIFSLLMSKNKTIWIAFFIIALFLVVYKMLYALLQSNYYQSNSIKQQNSTLLLLSKINSHKIIFIALLGICFLLLVNTLLPEPIISMDMIETKLKYERGKAFEIIIALLERSEWLGGYGFGFVENYFSYFRGGEILGLGAGSGMVFNSYLDIWLSVSLLGVLLHMILLYISFDNRSFFTIVIPMFCFIFANFNPLIGSEYYYIFLGLSYGLILSIDKIEKQRVVL